MRLMRTLLRVPRGWWESLPLMAAVCLLAVHAGGGVASADDPPVAVAVRGYVDVALESSRAGMQRDAPGRFAEGDAAEQYAAWMWQKRAFILDAAARVYAANGDAEEATRCLELLDALLAEHPEIVMVDDTVGRWLVVLAALGEVEAVDAAVEAAPIEDRDGRRTTAIMGYLLADPERGGRVQAVKLIEASDERLSPDSGKDVDDQWDGQCVDPTPSPEFATELIARTRLEIALGRWLLVQRHLFILPDQWDRVLWYAAAAEAAAMRDPESAKEMLERLEVELPSPELREDGLTLPEDGLAVLAASNAAVAYAALGDGARSAEMLEVVRRNASTLWGEPVPVVMARIAAARARSPIVEVTAEETRAALDEARGAARDEIAALAARLDELQLSLRDLGVMTRIASDLAEQAVLAGDDEGARAWVESFDDPMLRSAAAIGAAQGLIERRQAEAGIGMVEGAWW